MLNKMQINNLGNKAIPAEHKDELLLKMLHINLKHEKLLSIILLAIDFFLLLIEFLSTDGWNKDVHVYNRLSYMHFLLIITPLSFLLITHLKEKSLESNLNLMKVLHLSIVSLVLVFSAISSVQNGIIDKLPYPYIISMFCASSIILLGKLERYIMYLLSFIIYLVGCMTSVYNIYELVRNIFFFTLLVVLAIIISHIHYTSYVRDFINQKIIMDKNKELDLIYRATEMALIKRTEELNEAVEYEKLRGAFFANISHELRTPLTVIFSAEQMMDFFMEREDLDSRKKDIKQYMGIIKQNCYRLIRLVANLIDITKIDAGYFQVSFKNCDIIKVVEDIALSVAKFVEDRDISLIFDTEVEELSLACDPEKIERIILNLLSNAVKFTPKGGSIYVNIYEQESTVRISVRDTGIGVPENMRNSIFERFVQVDKTTSRSHEGSGIGLSIVKSLVDMHHGTITLNSEEGKGSEFIIELPKGTLPYNEIIEEYDFANENQNVEKISIEFSDIYK